MANNFVSPGVFSREVDVSFLGPAVGSIGAALVGMAKKGPAFVPVSVPNYSQFASIFGDMTVDNVGNPLAYAAFSYLKNAPSANIVRVLGPSGRTVNGVAVTPGYTAESMVAICALTGTTTSIVALLEVTASQHITVTDLDNDLFFLSGCASMTTHGDGITCSMLPTSQYYVKNALALASDPTKFSTYGYYLRDVYDFVTPTFAGGNALFSAITCSLTNFAIGYNSASSPWITSQKLGGQTYNLFRFHSIGHGEVENGRFSIEISNIKLPANNATPYGTFNVTVYDVAGNAVGSFQGCTLDPTSTSYIPKMIGDKYLAYNVPNNKAYVVGNYDGQGTGPTKYVRIEMAPTIANVPASALPWGFKGLVKPTIASGSATSIFPSLPLVADAYNGNYSAEANTSVVWGMDTVSSGSVLSRFTWLPGMGATDPDFSLAYVSGSTINTLHYNPSCLAPTQKGPTYTNGGTSWTTLDPDSANFMVPMAFGFDGFDRRIANQADNVSQLASTSQIGVQAFRQGIDLISDPGFIDINLLAVPGIFSKYVVDYGITAMENRADTLYIIDITGSSVNGVVSEIRNRNFDSNYAAVYFPSVQGNGSDTSGVNTGNVTLPASVMAIGAIAYNDVVSYPWFAPAGLNRAGLSPDVVGFTVTSVGDVASLGAPNQAERDLLYENRVNPIAQFPDIPGGVIWGQKTLQLKASALDRINVRRLLIKAKKLIASTVRYLVFEPGNTTTMTKFKQLVNPILADIQQKQGLTAFKVVMDSTTTPDSLIDQNTLKGIIYLVPSRAAEIISIDFVVSPTGAIFSA